MTRIQIRKTITFGVIFMTVTFLADYFFFTPNPLKTLVGGLAATIAYGWAMKRWHWDKEKQVSPESQGVDT
jgi:4-hydroxybenzoate polyprenyltransferase